MYVWCMYEYEYHMNIPYSTVHVDTDMQYICLQYNDQTMWLHTQSPNNHNNAGVWILGCTYVTVCRDVTGCVRMSVCQDESGYVGCTVPVLYVFIWSHNVTQCDCTDQIMWLHTQGSDNHNTVPVCNSKNITYVRIYLCVCVMMFRDVQDDVSWCVMRHVN